MNKGIALATAVVLSFTLPKEGFALSIDQFLRQMGVTTGGISQQTLSLGNQATFITGGSYAFRRKPSPFLTGLINFTAPRFSMGCNGLDFDLGGFYYIKDPQIIVNRLQKAATSAVYGFLVSLISSIPVIGQTLEYLQDLQKKFGAMEIDFCRTVVAKLDGQWPWAQARAKDKASQNGGGTNVEKSIDTAHKQATPVSYNLVAVGAGATPGMTYGDLHILMSLLGTIIVKDAYGSANKDAMTEWLEPTISLKDLISGDLTGKKQYVCEEVAQGLKKETDKVVLPVNDASKPYPCLNPTKKPLPKGFDMRKEYEDMILAMIYRMQNAKAPNNASVCGQTLASLLHGRTQAEHNEIFLKTGTTFVRFLRNVALDDVTDFTKPGVCSFLRVSVAQPMAPYLAISVIRNTIGGVLQKTVEVTGARKVPQDVIAQYLASVRELNRQLNAEEKKIVDEMMNNILFAQYVYTLEKSRLQMSLKNFNTK